MPRSRRRSSPPAARLSSRSLRLLSTAPKPMMDGTNVVPSPVACAGTPATSRSWCRRAARPPRGCAPRCAASMPRSANDSGSATSSVRRTCPRAAPARALTRRRPSRSAAAAASSDEEAVGEQLILQPDQPRRATTCARPRDACGVERPCCSCSCTSSSSTCSGSTSAITARTGLSISNGFQRSRPSHASALPRRSRRRHADVDGKHAVAASRAVATHRSVLGSTSLSRSRARSLRSEGRRRSRRRWSCDRPDRRTTSGRGR